MGSSVCVCVCTECRGCRPRLISHALYPAALAPRSPQHWPVLTTAFLAGMAPVGAAFGLLAWWRLNRMWRVAMLFERWTPQLPRREVARHAGGWGGGTG